MSGSITRNGHGSSGVSPTKRRHGSFYEKTKLEQQEGRFFPERYQQAGYDLVETGIDRHLLTITTRKPKSQAEERYFGAWWKRYFQGRRLNTVTVPALGAARQTLLRTAIAEGQEGVPERFITPH